MQVLRIAVYEIVHGSLPDHAISEHVELCKRAVRPDAANFVNGVLRGLMRSRKQGKLPIPEVPQEPADGTPYRCPFPAPSC